MAKVFTITSGVENLGAMKTGGQGSVYKGRRIGEIITAIKILPTPISSETADDKNFTSFQNEVQKLKKVNENPNPNVVKILSSGLTDSGNLPFIEMEYIEGPDLEELLQSPHDPIFSIKEIIKIADQLSNALAHCHRIDVMHGDVKSNNVKYNVKTGIYVLLDFGLAAMSDEQRRTSLRHAGAVEFMAPEQGEGQMLSQTDIYGFGVIMYELIAGTVPFPLKGKSESARNQVLVAHLETLPPDVLSLRREAIPETWSEEKKLTEMQVPEWLISMVYKCLEKKPENRFKTGNELHEYIWNNSIRSVNITEYADKRIKELEKENSRLRQEREQLQQQLLHNYHEKTGGENVAIKGHVPVDSSFNSIPTAKKSGFPLKKAAIISVVILALLVLVYVFAIKGNNDSGSVAHNNLGEYKVVVPRAYFYGEAAEDSRRTEFAVPGTETYTALNERNDFIYTEIEKGNDITKGWLRKQDLASAQRLPVKANASVEISADMKAQLQTAKQFFNYGKTVEALIIYNTLSRQGVPEAMYYYGKLALQNKNENLTCAEAFDLLKKASDKGYLPAKRTLGFIYSFADDDKMLQQGYYFDRCSFAKNVSKGSKLLMEAMLEGDTAASRLIDTLNARQGKG